MVSTVTKESRDPRVARVMLALASEPGDPITGHLVRKYGPADALSVVSSQCRVDGADKIAGEVWRDRLLPRLDLDAALAAIDTGERLGFGIITPADAEWPFGFDDLGDTTPLALWTRGDTKLLAGPDSWRVTVVGARAATAYGEHVTAELVTGLVRDGVRIVSGGAYGIDAAAHRATLATDGMTIAVMASGLDRLYPSGHQQLFERVASRGLLVSELPPGIAPTRSRLLQRARLLAALSATTVVVEAGTRSGSLETARQATALGRPVGAVPGPITSAASTGTNRLLQQRSTGVVTDANDIHTLRLGPRRLARDRLDHEALPDREHGTVRPSPTL